MESSPLLSVALITYNQEKYIAECIEGIVGQVTNFTFEIVIGEDYSTDNTREICKQYAEKYPDIIRLILPEKNLGMMGNWINTINSCKGKYVAICEGDDYWIDSAKLQKQVNFLEKNPDFSLCATAARSLSMFDNSYEDVALIKDTLTTKELLTQDWGIMTATIVFRKEALDMPEWFAKVQNGDYSLQLLVSLQGKIKCLSDVTSVYRVHIGGVSRKLTAFRQAAWVIYLISEFDTYTQGKFKKEIKKKIKRIYKNQLRFAKETKLRRDYCKLKYFQFLSGIAPFYIKNYRK